MGGEWGAEVSGEQGQPRPLATAVESLQGQTPDWQVLPFLQLLGRV